MIFARWGTAQRFHVLSESVTLCGRTPPDKGIVYQPNSPEAGSICNKCNRAIRGETKGESEKKRLERMVAADINDCQLGNGCKRQHKFHETRLWRFDFAYPEYKIALEVHGGTYMRGAHSRGPQQRKDMEKASEAAILGWLVLFVDSNDVKKKVHIDRIQRALEARQKH